MKLLTWNLSGKTKQKDPPRYAALDLAVTLLHDRALSDFVIGCVQEPPVYGDALQRYVEQESDRLSCISVNAKAHLIYSRDLRLQSASPDRTGRAIVAKFETESGSRVDIVGVHREDKSTLEPDAARGGASALLRANLDELMDEKIPAIILGDFNAEPASPEISHDRCFFALTESHRFVDRHAKSTGTHHRPFYIKGPTNGGTYYYQKEECWKTLDFFMVSDELRERFTSVERLDKLSDLSLVTDSDKGKRVPKPKISDHLPVLAELHFQ